MITSSTKLIAALAISAGLLTASAALAKSGPGKSGSGGNRNMSQKSSSNVSAFKFNSNNFVKKSNNITGISKKPLTLSSNNNNWKNHSNNISGISKKNLTLSQNFKKQDFNFKKQDFNFKKQDLNVKKQDFNFKKLDFNKDHKNSPLGISLHSLKKDNHKDFFCKKDNKCWYDWCYPKSHCFPYFGCYFPTYGCYDYYTPTYTTCNYSCSTPIVLQNVQPPRTVVAVGSILMVNGQAFGAQPGGARLRINGMAMPIEVLEWTPAGVKVRLPQIEITSITPAEIEVFRGDGSLASTTPVDLTASPAPLAFGR
jgi:IPT/TIG domain